jgi:hypothetical protein
VELESMGKIERNHNGRIFWVAVSMHILMNAVLIATFRENYSPIMFLVTGPIAYFYALVLCGKIARRNCPTSRRLP